MKAVLFALCFMITNYGFAASYEEACKAVGGNPKSVDIISSCTCGTHVVANPWFPNQNDKEKCNVNYRSPEEIRCEDVAKGKYEKSNNSCHCGKSNIVDFYEKCDNGNAAPGNIKRLIKVSGKSFTPDEVSLEGYRYRASHAFVATFSAPGAAGALSECLIEVSQDRENDNRVMPGGTTSYGRVSCAASEGACPSLKECIEENFSGHGDKARAYEIKYIQEKYFPVN